MEIEKKYPKPNNDFGLKILLSYYATLDKPQDRKDPIFSLIYILSEILSIINSDNLDNNNFSKFLYFNKNNIHNILFDNEEKIIVNFQNYSLSFLYYLSLLIRDNPDIVFYSYSIDYLRELNNMRRNNNKIYENIIISKLILELIENYKNKDDFQYDNRNRQELEKITNDNEVIIQNNIGTLRELDLNLNLEDIKLKAIDEIYTDIIINLIKLNKFQIYEFTYNILTQLDIESIDITKTIFEKLSKQLNSKENYINMIKNIEDLFDTNKINFYYFILRYILKDSNYIYQNKFLKESRKSIMKILKKESNKIANNDLNEIIMERLIYIINILCDSEYYSIKYLNQDLKRVKQIKQEKQLKQIKEVKQVKEIKKVIPDYKELKEILLYYKNYLFTSKANDINRIEEIIRNSDGDYKQYLTDIDKAKNMNDRYDIIDFMFNTLNKNAEKNEENLNKFITTWEACEKQIKDKRLKKMRKEHKNLIFKYFNMENKKDILLKIFDQDKIDFIITESQAYKKENKVNQIQKEIPKEIKKENISNDKLKEVLKFYKNFLFDSKLIDISIMENAIKNGEDENNYKEYLNQWEFAKKRNDRYDIIKYIINYKKRKSNNNNNINENDFIQTAQTWDNLENEIRDKKVKKMRREDKIMMYNYFNDANNRETILKIFNQDIIQYFNEHYMDKSINKEKKDEINDINKLNEILNYYKNYLFISKKNQINILEEIVRNKNGNYKEYLNDYDIAKKMNERYDIINYLYESKNKNIIRTEENFNKSVKKWEQLEKLIKNKK